MKYIMMKQDLHLHSDFSDGKSSIAEMVDCAIKLGIEKICFTDHVRRDTPWVESYHATVREQALKHSNKIQVSCGVEAKLLDHCGTLDLPVLPFDDIVVVAAIHRIPKGKGEFLSGDTILDDIEASLDAWMKTLEGTISNKRIDRLAHPFSHIPKLRKHKDDSAFWSEILSVFRNTEYDIEYNTKYDNSMVPDYVWSELRNRIVFGSDSHSTFELTQRNSIVE